MSVVKSRANLIVYYQNEKGLRKRCGLCGRNIEEQTHHATCPFADASITHVQLGGMKAQVVIHRDKKCHYWISPTGQWYNIRRSPGGYTIKKAERGSKRIGPGSMAYIRQFIEDNQGVL
jgi:hypothetical protein